MYFIRKNKKEKTIKAMFMREIYFVNNFKTNMLINNNIFNFEKFNLFINKEEIYINSCDITILINVQRRFAIS